MMENKPNILLLMADQLRFDALGCYGNDVIHTPNLDRMALTGSTFDNHFVQNPVCSPSRCSLLTGRYPRNHGVRDNGIPLRESEITLPRVLRRHGYRTAAIGKMHLTPQFQPKENEEDDWPADRYGFDVVHTTCDAKTGEYLSWLRERSPEDYQDVKLQGERKALEDMASAADKALRLPPQMHKNGIKLQSHQSAWIADRAIDMIRETEPGKPFFAVCSFVDPHHPFDPPAPYDAMYAPADLPPPLFRQGELADKPPHFLRHHTGTGYGNEKYNFSKMTGNDWARVKAAYYGMVSLVDCSIGRILDALAAAGLERNTLVLFTSDHGELLGDHGLLFKGPFQYDSIIKAPMIAKWPGVVPAGSRYAQVTEHVDLMPTILEYAGIRPPNGVQGMSMASIIRGDTGAGREYAMTEFNCHDWGLNVKTLTGRDYKITCYAGEDYGELYDRRADPGEFVNLWDRSEYADIKTRLLKKMLDRLMETEDTLPLRVGRY